MPKLTIEDLHRALEPAGARIRFRVFDEYCKQKPTEDAVPALRLALADDYHAVVKCAAHALRKLGAAGIAAFDDLLLAAQKTDASGMPQAYAECLAAMVAIAPNHPQLLPLMKRFVGLDNWVPISASLKALHEIGTPSALELLQRMAAFWEPELSKTQLRVVSKLLQSVEE